MKSNQSLVRYLELLAPARNAEIAIAAIDHGADAVYIGASHHGARYAASNTIDDVRRVVEYAHQFNARVYVTVNTLIYDNELSEVNSLVWDLYRIGVDALIVQDMALLEMELPPIALHASTQCDIRTPARARFLQDAGFTQLVLARELTLTEIESIRAVTTVPLEVFVHGALCVSYSGNCQASCLITQRSANRGECAQMCRLPYNLIDGSGKQIVAQKHLLSLRDMNRIGSLRSLVDAGVDSFKIEGRLKDMDYVKTVVSTYSDELDNIVASCHDGTLKRRARGTVVRMFKPDLADVFNRGYTDYFLHNRYPKVKMASIDTPKSIGSPIGTVKRNMGRFIEVRTDVPLSNGDGIAYYDSERTLHGFRVNRVEGSKIYLMSPVDIKPGTVIYRNRDAKRESVMLKTTARRVLPLDMVLRTSKGDAMLVLDVSVCGNRDKCVTVSTELNLPVDKARTSQSEIRQKTLAKLGGTCFELRTLDDQVAPYVFIPLSVLSELKRKALTYLEHTARATYCVELRNFRDEKKYPTTTRTSLDYTDNVANALAWAFYEKTGVESVEPAIECQEPKTETRVMLTRYCLRRELGLCLKTPAGASAKEPLTLRSSGFEFRLSFDCRNCEMRVYTSPGI